MVRPIQGATTVGVSAPDWVATVPTFATSLLPRRGCIITVRRGTLVGKKLVMGVGSSVVPPLGVRAVLIAQAGATEGSATLLNAVLISISIVLLEGDGPSMGL